MNDDNPILNKSAPDDRPDLPALPGNGMAVDPISRQARLARDARTASLRAMAGRLAHQIRNPLAAVRAACSSLHEECEDADQRETLELTLVEIDRMLGFVTATVKTIPDDSESPRPVDIGAEMADVVQAMQSELRERAAISLHADRGLAVRLPRAGLRATLYSVLDHLAVIADASSIDIAIADANTRVQIGFTVAGGMAGDAALTTGMLSPTGWVQPVGLLVAERFARDHGGSLRHAETSDGKHVFTLDLPADHV